jgi:hypothetical protein
MVFAPRTPKSICLATYLAATCGPFLLFARRVAAQPGWLVPGRSPPSTRQHVEDIPGCACYAVEPSTFPLGSTRNACSARTSPCVRSQPSHGPFAMPSVTRRAPPSTFPGRIRTATRADGCRMGCSRTPFDALRCFRRRAGFVGTQCASEVPSTTRRVSVGARRGNTHAAEASFASTRSVLMYHQSSPTYCYPNRTCRRLKSSGSRSAGGEGGVRAKANCAMSGFMRSTVVRATPRSLAIARRL